LTRVISIAIPPVVRPDARLVTTANAKRSSYNATGGKESSTQTARKR
jgi:hypothetical protein